MVSRRERQIKKSGQKDTCKQREASDIGENVQCRHQINLHFMHIVHERDTVNVREFSPVTQGVSTVGKTIKGTLASGQNIHTQLLNHHSLKEQKKKRLSKRRVRKSSTECVSVCKRAHCFTTIISFLLLCQMSECFPSLPAAAAF